ncbi:DEAD/DEAH box helicase [Noviherbaspirillum sp.]|jgi:preprotein translocase subunit SecA|uniref:preprotein translocase subunit SecA n=1 Tax=Noviherbaspirillum sp. TaxID=1926288 RepID=UPI0025D9C57D|nr:DEAD/DEAH box helicase [Noviherbaspirillum sp.]
MHKTLSIPRPGVRYGAYPERVREREPSPLFSVELLRARLSSARSPASWERAGFLRLIHQRRARLIGCDKEFVAAGIRQMRSRLILDGMRTQLVAEAFVLIDAILHARLNLRLHDTQFLAAWLMLDRRLVEMQTGEGKTLAVAVAAATCALAGIPVHVVTSNDYLVERDAACLAPVFHALGLTVGTVISGMSTQRRAQAYRCDITYCTAKELAFDYLRDHLASPADRGIDQGPAEHRLRGLCMAIVDEADSVLIDEARMPLILSEGAPNREQSAFYRQALFLAAQLSQDRDFLLEYRQRTACLTAEGKRHAEILAGHMGAGWNAVRRREETLCLALAAQHLFVRDVHYLVRDKQVVIIDETTGRPAEGRVWSSGLQQLIETKENCPLTEPAQTAAQITFQRFFSRYLRLSGVSGTLSEARDELLAIYGLPVVRVPLLFPCRRRILPGRVFLDKSLQWRYVVGRVRELTALGQPVLIGTGSVNDSEALSEQLARAGIRHAVLNARCNADEAPTIAEAGQAGAVTVSTNMAGRGTDIRLGADVAALGGLHVIVCQSNDSRRIDRQLYGRCARQGDPGSVEQLYCVEDSLSSMSLFAKIAARFGRVTEAASELPRWLTVVFLIEQAGRERARRREHWLLFLNDRWRDRQLAFIGRNE